LSDPEARFGELVTKLRDRGHRLTPQRIAVLRILAASEDHPSVEQIYDQIVDQFPTTSLATVYKTVTLLKGAGEVLELGFGNGSNRYDGKRPYPHPHLICTHCGEICDLEAPALSELVQQVSQDVGCQITSHRLDFYGLCSRCQIDDRS
jgi:Fur family peroxide stress response transcriptional regulator